MNVPQEFRRPQPWLRWNIPSKEQAAPWVLVVSWWRWNDTTHVCRILHFFLLLRHCSAIRFGAMDMGWFSRTFSNM